MTRHAQLNRQIYLLCSQNAMFQFLKRCRIKSSFNLDVLYQERC